MPYVIPTPTPLGLLVRRWPERRRVVLGSASLLLVTIVAALVAANDPAQGLAFLAVVPIVLVALEFGQWGGLAVAAMAFACVLAAAASGHPKLDAVGIATRGVVFLATGAAAGRFSDRMRAAYAREERLLRSGLRLSEASGRERLAEIAVREAQAMPGVVGAAVQLEGLHEVRRGRLEGTHTSLPLSAHGLRVGTLDTVHDGSPGAEERAALDLLARQTAIVAESLRLLDLDGERAALEARLRDVRSELLESRSGAGLLLAAEEEGKRRMAEKLHEDLAQVLSAVLLGMRMLERSSAGGGSEALRELHEQVARVLSEVRDVARELRPVVLDQLGLAAALEALARAAEDRGAHVQLHVGDVPSRLADDVETGVYRLVEDAFALDPRARVDVALDGANGGVEVAIGIEAPPPETLLALRARAESAGGTVAVSDGAAGAATVLTARMPAAG